MSSQTTTWVVSMLFGAAIVGFGFWGWFDKPSYDKDTACFSKYKPSFSTYYPTYARARYGYVLTFICIFIVLSLVPDIFFVLLKTLLKAFTDSDESRVFSTVEKSSAFPIVVALALAAVPRIGSPTGILKDYERRLRASFHAVAKIPEGVRRVVNEIRN